jgi:hypothetical protein
MMTSEIILGNEKALLWTVKVKYGLINKGSGGFKWLTVKIQGFDGLRKR